MNKAILLTYLLTALCLVSPAAFAERPAKAPPNVLLIITDDQGLADFSHQGHPYLQTPNMDRLREQSAVIDTFLVAPVCAPTRAGVLTGRDFYRTGVHDTYQSRVNMHEDEVTIAEYLKRAGYATALFGKWHLGYNQPMHPNSQGFDEYLGWEEMQHTRYNPLMDDNGVIRHHDGFLSDIFAEHAMDFILRNKDRPFFCAYTLYLPHTHPDNTEIPQRYQERFKGEANLTPKLWSTFAMIEKADELVGEVLGKIDELGLAEETIVIFMSDNGPNNRVFRDRTNNYQLGLRGYKTVVYENGIRSPFFVRWPEHIKPRIIEQTTGFYTDVLPTVMDLAGVAPESYDKPLSGHSLAPALLDDETLPERTFYMHFVRQGPVAIRANMWKNSAVRTNQYKLVNGDELYDLERDPGETTNIADAKTEIVSDYRQRYEDWFASVTAERDLTADANQVDATNGKTVQLYFFEKDQEKDPAGWPIEVLSPGPYTIAVEHIQHDMFSPGTVCRLRVGDLERTEPLRKHLKDVVFEDLILPEGDHTVEIDFIGEVTPRKWRYNLEDLGHRIVQIIPQK